MIRFMIFRFIIFKLALKEGLVSNNNKKYFANAYQHTGKHPHHALVSCARANSFKKCSSFLLQSELDELMLLGSLCTIIVCFNIRCISYIMLWNEVKISALQSEDMKISGVNQAHHPSQRACGLTRFSRSLVFREMQVCADVCRHSLCFFWCLQSLEGFTTGQELFCILINCLPINSSV